MIHVVGMESLLKVQPIGRQRESWGVEAIDCCVGGKVCD